MRLARLKRVADAAGFEPGYLTEGATSEGKSGRHGLIGGDRVRRDLDGSFMMFGGLKILCRREKATRSRGHGLADHVGIKQVGGVVRCHAVSDMTSGRAVLKTAAFDARIARHTARWRCRHALGRRIVRRRAEKAPSRRASAPCLP